MEEIPTPAAEITGPAAQYGLTISAGPEGSVELATEDGKKYRFTIIGRDISGMRDMREIYNLIHSLMENEDIRYVSSKDAFSIKVPGEEGRTYLQVQRIEPYEHTYRSASHVRNKFFREQLGYEPTMPAEAPREMPERIPEAVPARIAPPAEAVHDATWARDMHESIIARIPALKRLVRERDLALEEGEYERQAEMDRFLAELVRDYVTFRNEMPRIRREVEARLRSTGTGLQVLDDMKRIEERMGRDGRRIAEAVGMSARDLVAFADSYFAGMPAPPPAPAAPPAVAAAERPAPAPAVEAAERPPEAAPPAAAERPPVEAASGQENDKYAQQKMESVDFHIVSLLLQGP
jgi:hypothetical protein